MESDANISGFSGQGAEWAPPNEHFLSTETAAFYQPDIKKNAEIIK